MIWPIWSPSARGGEASWRGRTVEADVRPCRGLADTDCAPACKHLNQLLIAPRLFNWLPPFAGRQFPGPFPLSQSLSLFATLLGLGARVQINLNYRPCGPVWLAGSPKQWLLNGAEVSPSLLVPFSGSSESPGKQLRSAALPKLARDTRQAAGIWPRRHQTTDCLWC